ncbi:hypothetical protein [Phocaeicola vulgatus]|uniref:hypothetical protein n=1 Tax=Phocaeicola vulgatus TaxID=821 RepID=UPI003569AABC
MRKFFLGAALVAASFGMAQSADAATVMGVEGVSTVLAISDYEGTYNGTMDKIKMKGKDYEPRAASYTLEGGLLTCDFPQIGSMPGTITIELNVNVDEETGEITADSGVDAGYLTILGMDFIHLTQWGRHHYPVGKAAMPLKTLPVCNRRRGNKIIQTA